MKYFCIVPSIEATIAKRPILVQARVVSLEVVNSPAAGGAQRRKSFYKNYADFRP
jgi:hypothetical protein